MEEEFDDHNSWDTEDTDSTDHPAQSIGPAGEDEVSIAHGLVLDGTGYEDDEQQGGRHHLPDDAPVDPVQPVEWLHPCPADHPSDILQEPIDAVHPGYGQHLDKPGDKSRESSGMTIHQGEHIHPALGGHGEASEHHGRAGARENESM